jgi:hypothetical protein
MAQGLVSKCNGVKKRNRTRISDHVRMGRRQPVWRRHVSSENRMIEAVSRIYIILQSNITFITLLQLKDNLKIKTATCI